MYSERGKENRQNQGERKEKYQMEKMKFYRNRIKLVRKGKYIAVCYCGRSWNAQGIEHAFKLIGVLYYLYEEQHKSW